MELGAGMADLRGPSFIFFCGKKGAKKYEKGKKIGDVRGASRQSQSR